MGGTGIGSLGILFLVFCGLSVILCSCSPTSCYYAGKLGEGVEEVNFYKPGGFHPVLLGDVLDGRFTHRGNSVVLPGSGSGKWRAVKIFAASRSDENCANLELPQANSPREMYSLATPIPSVRIYL